MLLDDWLTERWPIKSEAQLRRDLHSLPMMDLDHEKDNSFAIAMIGAIDGNGELLSGFITVDKWFCYLTPIKRKVIGWFICNPVTDRRASRNKHAKLSYCINMTVLFESFGMTKTKAIEAAVKAYLGMGCYDEATLSDRVDKKYDSLRTQMMKAIGNQGEYSELYNRTRNALTQELKS